MKTIIGKNNYLFLSTEVEKHTGHIGSNHGFLKQKYLPYMSKLLLIIFPSKCVVCKSNLPDDIQCDFRDGLKNHKEVLQNNIIDCFEECNEEEMFYKTDSHMNLLGAERVYKMFLKKMSDLFNLSINEKKIIVERQEVNALSDLKLEMGDLAWIANLGNQQIDSTKDNFFYSEEVEIIFCKRVVSDEGKMRVLTKELKDITKDVEGQRVEWNNILSPYILFQRNEESEINKKVIIFYDSFLVNTLSLYLEMFREVFLIKTEFQGHYVDIINPDYVIEFRAERFL
jgi:hypothetical protein